MEEEGEREREKKTPKIPPPQTKPKSRKKPKQQKREQRTLQGAWLAYAGKKKKRKSATQYHQEQTHHSPPRIDPEQQEAIPCSGPGPTQVRLPSKSTCCGPPTQYPQHVLTAQVPRRSGPCSPSSTVYLPTLAPEEAGIYIQVS